MKRGWEFGLIPSLRASEANAIGELLWAIWLLIASRSSLKTCASRCNFASVNASWVDIDVIANITKIISNPKTVLSMVSDRDEILEPVSSSGTIRKIAR